MIFMPIDALNVLCAQLTRDLFAIESSCSVRAVSKPYIRIGIHLLEIICKMTSSDAVRPILLKLLLAAR